MDILSFRDLHGRTPTTQERCDMLNARNTSGARWVVKGSQEWQDMRQADEDAKKARKILEVEQDARYNEWINTVSHLELQEFKSEVQAIHYSRCGERYDGEWLGSLEVSDRGSSRDSYGTALWMYRCAVQELPNATAQERAWWVRENFDEGKSRYRAATSGPFHLGWDRAWLPSHHDDERIKALVRL